MKVINNEERKVKGEEKKFMVHKHVLEWKVKWRAGERGRDGKMGWGALQWSVVQYAPISKILNWYACVASEVCTWLNENTEVRLRDFFKSLSCLGGWNRGERERKGELARSRNSSQLSYEHGRNPSPWAITWSIPGYASAGCWNWECS